MPESQWTVETLKAYIEAVLIEKDKALSAALASAEKAVGKAEENAQRWRESANEWRGAMTDREKNFATKAEVQALKERADQGQGKSGGLAQGWAIAIGVVSLIGAILVILLKFAQ